MNEETVALLGSNTPIMRSHDTATGTIDSFSVSLHPLTHLCQALQCYCRKLTIWLRTDIHQQIGILSSRIYQVMNQSFGRLIILVGNLITPHAVHGLAGFKRQTADVLTRQSCLILSRKITLESLNILTLERRRVMVVYDQAAWLQAMDKRILLWQLPIEVRILILIPPSIKPDTSHLTVVGKKLSKLIVHKLIVALPVSLRIRTASTSTRSSPYSILTIPVDMRVIKVQSDALLVALISQLLHDVATERSSIYNIIIRILGLEHRESLVMASGEADVLGTRSLDGSHPFGSIKLRRIETACQLSILLVIQVLIGHCPFAGSEHAVQSPMQEDTELIILELLAGFQIFRRWLIMLNLVFLVSIIPNHGISC